MSSPYLFRLVHDYARKNLLSDVTRRSMLRAVALLDAYVGRRATVTHLRPRLLRDFAKSLEGRFTPTTIAGYVYAIERVWRHAEQVEATKRPAPKRKSECDDGAYLPTQRDIRLCCAAIRKSWNDRERQRRRECVA